MNILKMRKILFLFAIVVLSYGSTWPISPLYRICDTIGYMTDWFLTKGDLSIHNQKIFAEVATKLGIQDRNIKPRNSGLLLRLTWGYNNALAMAQTNRVYFNDTELNKLSEEEKRFLMAHELTHHHQHHIWKIIATSIVVDKLLRPCMAHTIKDMNSIPPFIKNYLTYGYGWYINSILLFTLWGLLQAQCQQIHETEADTHAITLAGVDPEAGVRFLQTVYYPDTTDWPLYAKVGAFLQKIMLPIFALPVIKQHVPHLASYQERIAYLRSLKNNVPHIHTSTCCTA
jgi:Zn-dependent protease with chaperone function